MLARRHARLTRHTLTVAWIPLHVVLVGHGLLRVHGDVGGHVVTSRHVRVLGHPRASLRRHVLRRSLFGRLGLVAFDAVLVARSGFGCVQAGLTRMGQQPVRSEGCDP